MAKGPARRLGDGRVRHAARLDQPPQPARACQAQGSLHGDRAARGTQPARRGEPAKAGELTIICDCDVIQADGGTRTAAITGAWVALHDAVAALLEQGALKRSPLTGQVAAISMGYVGGEALLDLDYPEDSHAEVDMNLVGCEDDRIVEVQGTGERATLGRPQLDVLLDLGQEGIRQLLGLQRQAVGHEGERALGGR